VRNRLRVLGQSAAQVAALEQATGPLEAAATVDAPLRGTVIDRQVGPGQFIQAGSASPVFTIGDLSTVWLVANVRQQDAPLVRRGQSVEVRVGALPGRVLAARITQVAPAVDPNTHRLAVRATVDNPDGALKPEMFATFRIVTGAARSAPAVPDSAVIYEGDSARLWVLDPDGSITPRTIVTGRSDGGLVEVLNGVSAGQRIVAGGSLFIDRAAGVD
jgi:membrane fusion protein, heavy metal efflux system